MTAESAKKRVSDGPSSCRTVLPLAARNSGVSGTASTTRLIAIAAVAPVNAPSTPKPEDNERDADREAATGLRDKCRAHPHEAREALQQAHAEREDKSEEQREAEQRNGERRQLESRGDRAGEDDDDEPENSASAADAHRPAAHERMERGLLVARAVLRGELGRRGLDDLARDRLEDQDAEERGEDRVLLRS